MFNVKKMLRIGFWLFGFAILALASLRPFYLGIEGFSLKNIEPDYSYHEGWQEPKSILSNDEARQILQMPFTYLGKGAQVYAFESQDGKWVLKIIKHKHFRTPWWDKVLFILPGNESYKAERDNIKKFKIERLLESISIAGNEIPKETELAFVHIMPTDSLKIKTSLKDKFGLVYQIDMDKMQYLIQKKGTPLSSVLEKALREHDEKTINESLIKIIHLIQKIYAKGIIDTDGKKLIENVGFQNGEAMYIDLGSFRHKTGNEQEMITELTIRLRKWLNERSPEAEKVLNHEINQL